MKNETDAAARELMAWFKSGNSIPIDLDFQFSRIKHRIMADVERLDKAVNDGS